MHAARGDADFATEPELSPIGELGRRVVHDDRRIDAGQERFGRPASSVMMQSV